jgi:hypothetical protein
MDIKAGINFLYYRIVLPDVHEVLKRLIAWHCALGDWLFLYREFARRLTRVFARKTYLFQELQFSLFSSFPPIDPQLHSWHPHRSMATPL